MEQSMRLKALAVLLICVFAAAAGSELNVTNKVHLPRYNHTLATILVEYASAVYMTDLSELLTWTCPRCDGLTKGCQIIELIVDVQHCLQAFVGVAEDLNAIVIAFRGTQERRSVFCPIAGCGARLRSLDEFEDHYSARDTASCSVCSRVYLTSRLLDIHVSETHDSFFHAKVARGFPMYECLVEGCGLKFMKYKDGQKHLVDKHKFPASFDFFKKAQPSKKHRQKQQKRKQVVPKEGSNNYGN